MKRYNKYIIAAEYKGLTIEEYLKQILKISGRQIQKLTRAKGILLNGKAPFLQKKLKGGECLQVLVLEDRDYGVEPEEGNLNILYEDQDLIILNKPPGILVHPTGRTTRGTLANHLAYYYQTQGWVGKVRPIHRLDRDTSGCVAFAKQASVQSSLEEQLSDGTMKRRYLALVDGFLNPEKGTIDVPIGQYPGKDNRRAVREDGEKAVTRYKALINNDNYSLVEVELETGKTHQIRVHMAYMGHPVIGDKMYGKGSPLIGRQALHASSLKFIHPRTKEKIKVEAPLFSDMQKLIDKLKSIE